MANGWTSEEDFQQRGIQNLIQLCSAGFIMKLAKKIFDSVVYKI